MTGRLVRALAVLAVLAGLAGVALSGCGSSGGSRSRPRAGAAGAATSGTATTSASTTTPASTAGTTPAPPSTSGSAASASASASAAVTYGIADAPGEFASCGSDDLQCCDVSAGRCALAHMTGYFDDALFLRLLSPASAHRVRDVRLFVPYDAVEQWNGSTTAPGCEYSEVRQRTWTNGAGVQPPGEAIDELLAGVIEARADGLEPMVTITGYPFAGLRPPWDAPFPDPSTTDGAWEYRCGLQGILGELGRLPSWEQPHVWESVNEPEAFAIFDGSDVPPSSQCDAGAAPQPDGPGKAACLESIASTLIHGYAGHGDDTVIAGTFKEPDPSYLDGYAAELARLMPGSRFPSTWSVHDYPEVTGAYTGAGATELAEFDRALATDSDGRARSLWITESGTVLTSTARAEGCPAAGVDSARSLGACINGNVDRQIAAADAFFALPHAASTVPVTHLFWYQFIGAPLWDSGLIDPTGQPRAAYCIFFGQGSCSGSPDAD